MIDAVSKGLTQNTAVIKAAPPVTRSRAFALWLALLVLYFLLVPTAADTPDAGTDLSAAARHTITVPSGSRPFAPPHGP